VVLEWSTPRRSWSGLVALLIFLRDIDGIHLPDGGTHELVVGLALERASGAHESLHTTPCRTRLSSLHPCQCGVSHTVQGI
jgi:hypothetical protein